MGTDCGTSARTAAVASAGGLAQKRALDSPERREAVWGLPDCGNSPATLRSRLRGTWDQGLVCAIGDRTGIGRGKQGIENCEQRVVGRRAYNRQRRRCTSAEKHRLASSLGGARDQRRAAGESKWVGR